MLIIVPTPIGNLKDITLRSLETLQNADGIICEDTRVSGKLLHHYEIQKPLLVLNDYNETKTFASIIERLKNGENLALISDAGTPLVSDPGYKLVRSCIEEKIAVDSLPGASSVTTALTLSGLAPDKFMFLGFLPDKPGHRQTTYQKIKSVNELMPTTFILFVSPYKVAKSLAEMEQFFGDMPVTLARELTKIYQTVEGKPISQWLQQFKKSNPRGEYVLLFRLPGA